MAHYAANFTTTSQCKPSVLEILAQDSLSEIFYPAIRTLILASSYPEKYNWLFEHHEEILLAINGLLQYYYFKNFDASFSENFYGLKRVYNNDQPLGEFCKLVCASYAAFLPYLKRKMEGRYNLYMAQDIEGTLENGFTDRMKKKFMMVYPLLKSGCAGDFSRSFVKNMMISALEGLAFYTQFIQSLNNLKPNFNTEALPKISAPIADNKSKNFKEKCPICKQYWKLPSVLLVSGYVFCFTCIMKHLREHQYCPVTKVPAKPLDIVRIFEGE
ncbi:peroxisome assembly protein 12 isoform X2 [Harmonia axyridis]|uniref:peroxisome assembly protein 12 isoform X2 n=1 Tax=Harmonia axyridis TaxID=115357 RepID=UPI001E276584|nr:peroxisome assembly protein 12 isoform X2 [Harmonia axyridis]